MAKIDEKFNIETNRGDMLPLTIKTNDKATGGPYTFKKDDVVRFKIMEAKDCSNVVLQKDVKVVEPSETVQIVVPSEEMKIGEIINKPAEYWYEVELNPDTPESTTILGYTKKDGARILTLTPEGDTKK